MVEARDADPALGGVVPCRWVFERQAVADLGLLCVELDRVAAGDPESQALARLEQLTGSDALAGDAGMAQGAFQTVGQAPLKASVSRPGSFARRRTRLWWSRSSQALR